MCKLFFIILIAYSSCPPDGICLFFTADPIFFFLQRTFFRSFYTEDGISLRRCSFPAYRIRNILEVLYTVFSTGSENSRTREFDPYEVGADIALAPCHS